MDLKFENGIVGSTLADDSFTLKAAVTAPKEMLTISDTMEEVRFKGVNVRLTATRRYQVCSSMQIINSWDKLFIFSRSSFIAT